MPFFDECNASKNGNGQTYNEVCWGSTKFSVLSSARIAMHAVLFLSSEVRYTASVNIALIRKGNIVSVIDLPLSQGTAYSVLKLLRCWECLHMIGSLPRKVKEVPEYKSPSFGNKK